MLIAAHLAKEWNVSRKVDYLKYMLSLLLFGSNGIVAAAVDAEAVAIVFWRTLLGSLLLAGIFVAKRQCVTVHHRPKDAAFLLLSGASTGMSWVFLYEAYRLAGVGVSTVIYYIGPVAVMALSPMLFKERLTAGKVCCLGIVLVGAILLNSASGEAGVDPAGLACAFASAACHAVMVIFNKLASRTQGLENPMLQLAISFATVAVYLLFAGKGLPAFPVRTAMPLVVLGLVNTGLGCYLYFSSLGGLRAQSIVVLGYLEPLSAVVLALLLLGEPMSLVQAAGCAMIIGGALLAELAPHARQ